MELKLVIGSVASLLLGEVARRNGHGALAEWFVLTAMTLLCCVSVLIFFGGE